MRVHVEADGGSRGNPGAAGYGAVVRDDAGAVLAERREYIGTATNNVAEYRGLIAGLEAARDLGAREVDVKMDSKLVVEQMSGRWKVKHPDMIPLALRAREVAAGFDRVRYQWIPRAQNKHADRLANEAMDAQGRELETPTTAEKPAARAVGRADRDRPRARSGREAVGTRLDRCHGRPTRLLLLRHGQTALSIENRYSGRGNPPLTDLGRDQAERSARMVAGKGGIAAVVSSPLGRALDTARASARALGLEVEVHDGLIETDFGAWEGATFREAAERDPDLHRRWLADASVLPAGRGELRAGPRADRSRARRPRRAVRRLERAGGEPCDTDQDAAATRAGGGSVAAVPAAPGPGVVVDRGVLPRRGCGGAVGELDGASGRVRRD